MLWIFLLWQTTSAAECAECPAQDVQMMIQVDRNHQTACAAAVPWPCNNDVVASYPLQVINQINLQDENDTDDLACNNGRGTAQIKRLNLEDGVYTDLCNIPGRCLNACGIHPQTNLLYCNERPGNDNLVRVDCDVNVAELEASTSPSEMEDGFWRSPGTVAGTVGAYVAVTGSLCFLGRLQNTFAANLDVDGNFWFKTRDATYDPRGGALYRITNATLGTLIGSTVPVTSGPRIDGARDNQVVVGRSNLRLIFDLIVVFLDFGPTLGVGEQEYVVGCWSNLVYVQQVSGDLTNADLITLEMVGATPGQSSPRAAGAQWLFNGSIYCAYNDGSSGVIQVLLTQTNLVSTTSGTVPAGRVSNSEATTSNDGMNCLLAASPFPPVTTSTTTTTSGGGRGTHTFIRWVVSITCCWVKAASRSGVSAVSMPKPSPGTCGRKLQWISRSMRITLLTLPGPKACCSWTNRAIKATGVAPWN